MDQSSTFIGAGLLAELRSSDGLSEREGKEWISRKSGRPYDADAMYALFWSDQEDMKTWGEYLDLRVKVMSDFDLDGLEREYRKSHHLPPRRPWEARMYGTSRGRSDR